MGVIRKYRLELNEDLQISKKRTIGFVDDGLVIAGLNTRMHEDGDRDQDLDEEQDIGTVVERVKPQLQKPPMYKVILLNDDYTPMEFVIEVLEIFFNMNREKATQIMLAVHTVGRATCGIYTRDIAETKSMQVNEFSQQNQHPLISDIEAAD